ncbi:ArsI/CadI family heavy metal resistance metalloenzyme [Sulfurirhabdus autotrophica]|uniref:Glyoxalase/bleomycin resistance protein/dioxygenase superfamily protein n=1 Tax=Sulfurirhabdus autotrophica TaxID=1706046 RepID=A0A4R3Y6M5_9PROT|nr:ArsI/CadI family heavy metal resistance metalloenzyme [Sulfurirhabdus autotrophica]TCV87486.1 glyoxalase/bleomycin resistance protein/dioxygenase superfamily protein [Sulfurirhabdus autotrophica]
MKRFHVHVSVKDLIESIQFYSTMFGQSPTVHKDDYAKWMLDDPRINFAISNRSSKEGVDHLGIQVDSEEELSAVQVNLNQATSSVVEQREGACCYAESNKYWVKDPAGIAWEAFHTLGSIPVFGVEEATDSLEKPALSKSGCCTPVFGKSGCC